MPDWRALFDFRGKGRATSHPQTHAPHRTLPATDQGALILGPDPVPPPPPPAADKPEPNPALRTHVPHRARHRTHRTPPATNQEVLISGRDPIPPPPPPAADKPKTNAAVGALPATNRMDQQESLPPKRTLNTHNTTHKVSTTTVNGLKLALRLLKEAVSGIQVPGLEAAVSGTAKVIDIIESVRSNDRDLEELSRRIHSIAEAVGKSAEFHQNEEVSEAFRLRLEAFLNELESMLLKVNVILSDRNLSSKTANSQPYKNAITDVNTRMDRLISQFSAQGIISLELNVARARRDVRVVGRKADEMRSNVDVVHKKMDGVHTKVDGVDRKLYGVDRKVIGVDQKVDDVLEAQVIQEYEALIKKVPRVHARYNDTSTKPSRPCHPETRTELLKRINKWIKYGPYYAPYLWLCGEVGVGKTTVAHTIAKEQESVKQLGASFFFSRHDHGRQAPHRLFPSIAYQLARFDRGIWRALAEVLKPDPDIVNRGLTEQFTKLILEPLSRSGMARFRTVVIVIDGLDECSDPASVLDALALGIEYVNVRLCVLVSNRPYAVIQSKFKNTPLYHLATQNHFHDINSDTLFNDVAIYLTWSLGEIASRPANRNLPSPWPAKSQLAELISRASGLFIIASTYTKYIDDPLEDNPAAQLKRILSRRRGVGSSPLAELDALYDQVLDDLRQSLKTTHELAIARDIIAAVILARSKMSIAAWSGLMCMEPSDVRSILRRLTAVILLPENSGAAITPFHASFGEYIQDGVRCTIRELAVNPASAHRRLASQCMATIVSVARGGIVGVEYTSTASIPLHLSYAGLSLADHIHSSREQAGRDREIFLQSGVLLWLNLMFMQKGLQYVGLHIERAGFTSLFHVEGQRADPITSVGRLMISYHAQAINRTPEVRPKAAMSATESRRAHRSEDTQIIEFKYGRSGREGTAVMLENIWKVLMDARHWNMHQNPNFLIRSVTTYPDSSPKLRMVVQVGLPANSRIFCTLVQYLKTNPNLPSRSRVRLALEIAKGVSCIHRTSPLQAHGSLRPDRLFVSIEGKVWLGPPPWSVVTDSDHPTDGDSYDCIVERSEPQHLSMSTYWPPPVIPEHRSPQASQFQDVWDFGRVLFQVMTSTPPLRHDVWRLAGNPNYADKWGQQYWAGRLGFRIYQARYETAVCLLLGRFNGPEEVKAVLRGCWAIEPQDRSSMRVVVEQLEAIIQSARDGP